jgi:hypothetical protein
MLRTNAHGFSEWTALMLKGLRLHGADNPQPHGAGGQSAQVKKNKEPRGMNALNVKRANDDAEDGAEMAG